jgi:guanylate kinase
MIRILVLAGPSGSGKTVLESKLVENYPNIFYKLQQFTTRDMRFGESAGKPYIFIGEEAYDRFEPVLIARVKSQFGGTKYGTIPDFVPNKIATLIASYEGYVDLHEAIKDGRLPDNTEIFLFCLDIDLDKIGVKREGRDEKFLYQEKIIFGEADYLHFNENGISFPSEDDVLTVLFDNRFLPS